MEGKIRKIYLFLVSIGVLIPFFSFAQVFNRDLYFGIFSDLDVLNLQKFLASVDIYSGPITGNFFSLTQESVKKFQAKEGITPVVGYFGPKTRAKVNEILNSRNQVAATVSDDNKETTDLASPRILIIGDSFMALGGGIGNPLEKDLLSFKDVGVYRFGKVSSGLSNPNYLNWNTKAQELISQYNPNIAIIMIGANDNQNLRTAEGKFILYGNQGWNEEYVSRVSKFLKIFEDNNITVFWVGQPIMRDNKFSDAMKNLNSIDEDEVKNYKNAYFISIWDSLTNSQGNYTDYLLDENGKPKLARVSDGIHLHYFAGGIVSQEIIGQMKKVINLEPK